MTGYKEGCKGLESGADPAHVYPQGELPPRLHGPHLQLTCHTVGRVALRLRDLIKTRSVATVMPSSPHRSLVLVKQVPVQFGRWRAGHALELWAGFVDQQGLLQREGAAREVWGGLDVTWPFDLTSTRWPHTPSPAQDWLLQPDHSLLHRCQTARVACRVGWDARWGGCSHEVGHLPWMMLRPVQMTQMSLRPWGTPWISRWFLSCVTPEVYWEIYSRLLNSKTVALGFQRDF